MDDLISRQAAVDAIEQLAIPEDMCVFEILSHIELAIGTLPSAQPEERTENRMETHACNLISRQSAIDALDKRFDNVPMENTTEILMLRKDLRELPGTFSQDNEKDMPPHGRLIDADKMYDRLIRLKDKSIRAGDWLESFAIGFTLGFMSKEETVIEATTRKVENGNSENRIKKR